jgi:predicted dehydrogenase
MISIGYAGPQNTPEFKAMSERKNARISAVYAPEDISLSPTDATVYPSAEALIDTADVDAIVVAVNSNVQTELIRRVASRGLPVLVVPPMAGSVRDAASAVESVAKAEILSAVARPIRHAINLIQIRRTVLQYGATSIAGRIVGNDVSHSTIEQMVDTLRYVGGDCERIISVADPSPQLTTCAWAYQSGVGGELSITRGWKSGEEFVVDVVSDGRRYRYYHGTNHIEIDETEHMAADKPDGQYVATIAAFITAVEQNTPSPLASSYSDAVDTLRMMHQLAEHSAAFSQDNG